MTIKPKLSINPSFPRRRESSEILSSAVELLFVIPAQAGIQQGQTSRKADKTGMLPRFAGIYNHLDSRLRGNDEFFGLMDNPG